MCINQQQQQAVFSEIEEYLEQFERTYVDRNDEFTKVFAEFDEIFRKANHANNLQYDQEAGKQNRCVFFFPFLDKGSPWQGSVEILKTSKYYIVFDRHGRFSVYYQSEEKFGSRVLTNSRDHAIAGLEGISAANLLFDARKMKRAIRRLKEERAENLLNIKLLHDRIAALQGEL